MREKQQLLRRSHRIHVHSLIVPLTKLKCENISYYIFTKYPIP